MQFEEKDLLETKNKKTVRRARPAQVEQPFETSPLAPPMPSRDRGQWTALLDKVFEWSLYGLVFLIPLFFLPFTSDALEFNKQALFCVGVFWLWLVYAANLIMNEKIEIKGTSLYIGFGALLLAWLSASVASINPPVSFSGTDSQQFVSFFTLLSGVALAVLLTHVAHARMAIFSLSSLIASLSLVSVIGILQLAGTFLFPWQFTKTTAFTPVGSYDLWGTLVALGLIIAVTLLIRLSLTETARKQAYSIALAICTGLFLIVLILLDDWRLWLGSILGLGVVLVTLYAKLPKEKKVAWLVLPSFIIVLAATLSFVHIQRFLPLPPLAQPTLATSAQLTIDTLKKAPLLGYGPGTFLTTWTQFHPKEINNINVMGLWSARFFQGSSTFFTVVAGVGILGLLAIILMIVLLGTKMVRAFLTRPFDDEYLSIVGYSSALIALAFFLLTKPSNMTLAVVAWLLVGLFSSLTARTATVISNSNSNRFLILSSLVLSVVCVAGLVGGITMGQRYVAELTYAKGLSLDRGLGQKIASGQTIQASEVDALINQLGRALEGNPSSSAYARALSQALVYKVQAIAKGEAAQDQLALLREATSLAIESGKRALAIHPRDIRNTENLASVYQAISPYTGGADQFAIEWYKKSSELDPQNPLLKVNLARVHLDAWARNTRTAQAEKDTEKRSALTAEAGSALRNADSALKEALSLKGDLPSAHYLLATVQSSQKRKEDALISLDRAVALNANLDAQQVDQSLFYLAGILYSSLDQQDKALQATQLALQLKPTDQSSLWLYANLLADKGEKANAQKVLERLLELNPTNEQVLDRLKELRGEKPQSSSSRNKATQATEPIPGEESNDTASE